MSGQLHWQRIPVGGKGGLAALFRDDVRFYGWVTSMSGKMWIAWMPPDDAERRSTPINVMTDGKYLGLYPDVGQAMDVVRIKCTPNQ